MGSITFAMAAAEQRAAAIQRLVRCDGNPLQGLNMVNAPCADFDFNRGCFAPNYSKIGRQS